MWVRDCGIIEWDNGMGSRNGTRTGWVGRDPKVTSFQLSRLAQGCGNGTGDAGRGGVGREGKGRAGPGSRRVPVPGVRAGGGGAARQGRGVPVRLRGAGAGHPRALPPLRLPLPPRELLRGARIPAGIPAAGSGNGALGMLPLEKRRNKSGKDGNASFGCQE